MPANFHILHSSGPRTPSQGQNTMAVKDGPGLRPVAQTAKRYFLNCLETSSKLRLCPPFGSATCQLARVLSQLARVLHRFGQRTPPQGPNTMALKDGSGPQPAAHGAKRCLLNCLETSSKLSLPVSSCSWRASCTGPVKGPLRRAQTPWH